MDNKMTKDAKELYEALQWKLDNGDCKDERKIKKIKGLCSWYSQTGIFTKSQIEFAIGLLGEE